MRDAKNLAETLTSDPQMRIPERPRLSEDLIKLWHNRQTLMVLGSIGDIVLRGKSVESLMPQLLPLLTGTLTASQIAERVQGFRPGVVEDALSLLYMQGLLEEGPPPQSSLTAEQLRDFSATLAFYSRYVDYTRASRSRYEVLETLRSSAVLMLGSGPCARQLLHELASLGLGQLTLIPLDQPERWGAIQQPHLKLQLLPVDQAVLRDGALASQVLRQALGGHRLILLAADTPQPQLTRTLNALALEHAIPFLRSYASGQQLELGPTVFANQSGCYECAHHMGLIDLEQPAGPAVDDDQLRPLLPEEQIAASYGALFSLAILTKFLPIKTGDSLYRLDAQTLALEAHAVYRLPGCPACSDSRGYTLGRSLQVGPERMESWPALFHLNTNEKSYNLFPKGHQMHYAPKNMKTVEGAYKEYRNRERVQPAQSPLIPAGLSQPFPALMASPPPARTGGVSAADISLLLGIAAGRQTFTINSSWQVGLRVTPSAGGMSSQTIYLASFAVEGLEPGLYHFNPHGSLEKVRAGQLLKQFERAVPGSEALGGTAVAALVETAAYGRVESKYLNKAYRYSCYDAGAMLPSLQVASQALGLQLWQSLDFYDQELSELLGLHTINELALYVAYLV